MAEEQNLPQENEEIKIDELDEKDLEDVSGGGTIAPGEESTNNGCNCSCG